MSDTNTKIIILFAAALLVGVGVTFHDAKSISPAGSDFRAGRNVLVADVASGKPELKLLENLAWRDVIPTVEGVSGQKNLAPEVMATTAALKNPTALYLRAMLQLAANDPRGASATFGKISPSEIPEALLYAPYRVFRSESGQPNPFRERMKAAVAQGAVTSLVQARVHAAEAEFDLALKAYMSSDPAEWTRFDVVQFRALRMQSPLANDTAAMLQAALKAGRVPQKLRPELLAVLETPYDKAALEQMKAQLLAAMHSTPDLRNAAIAGAEQQLAARQKFAQKKYREMLAEYRERAPESLPDETVLMLVLGSAQEKDSAAFSPWSQELTRRYPTPEVQKWIKQIRPAPR